MKRVFWDTMIFIYLLEGKGRLRDEVKAALRRSHDRGDALFTSHLVLGELLAGTWKMGGAAHFEQVRAIVPSLGFSMLAFDDDAVSTFSHLRGVDGVKAPDSINLACAASVGMDLFLTGDKRLVKLDVPGIQFIADIDTSVL